MIPDPVTTSGEHTLLQAIELMRQRRVDSLFVVSAKQQLKGIITARMIQQAPDRNISVKEAMKTDFAFAVQEDSIVDLLHLFKEHDVSAIPVLGDQNTLAGIITTSSLVTTLGARFLDM